MISPSVRFQMWFLSNVVTRIIKAPPVSLTDREVHPPEVVMVKTRHGHVRCLITRPAEGAPLNLSGRAPVHINFHGGAFLIGAPAQDEHFTRGIAGEVGAYVVNVDYTTAPKAHFPRSHEECFDVLTWVAGAGNEQGWDPERISVGGGSAGAHLALGVLELARRVDGPRVSAAVLVVPLVDVASPSSGLVSQIAKPMVSPGLMDVVNTAYFPSAATRTDVLASPLLGGREEFASLPPLFVASAEYDTLRPQIESYVERARSFGVDVTYRSFEGVDHDFPISGKVPPSLIQELGTGIRDHLLAQLSQTA